MRMPVVRRSATPARTGACAAAFGILFLLAASNGRAHVVYGTATLSQLTRDADMVARALVVDPHAWIVVEDPSLRRPAVTADVREVLKGDVVTGPLTFVPHGHGVAEYAGGDEILLFLHRIERSTELAATGLAQVVRWVSPQETADKIVLMPGATEPYLAAVRAYAAVEILPSPEARMEGLRRITVKLLTSREPRLASSAVRDLVRSANAPLITTADLPVVAPLLDDRHVAITTRIALLAELERRRIVSGPSEWVNLLRSTKGDDLVVVVRAVAAHPSADVTRALLAMLQSGDDQLAAAIAVSLGTAGNHEAVDPLAGLLGHDDPRVRMAAIRGLGRIGTRGSRRALELAGAFHPDPATRRRANAEVIVLARRQGTALGPTMPLPEPLAAQSSALTHVP